MINKLPGACGEGEESSAGNGRGRDCQKREVTSIVAVPGCPPQAAERYPQKPDWIVPHGSVPWRTLLFWAGEHHRLVLVGPKCHQWLVSAAGGSPGQPRGLGDGLWGHEVVAAGFVSVSIVGEEGCSACILLGNRAASSQRGCEQVFEGSSPFLLSSDCQKSRGRGSAPAMRQDIHVPSEGGHTRWFSLQLRPVPVTVRPALLPRSPVFVRRVALRCSPRKSCCLEGTERAPS